MKSVILLFLVLFVQSVELGEVRSKYPSASASREASAAFLNFVDHITKSDSNTLVAYKGAALTLQAKFAGKVSEKKKYFTEGAMLVEQAILAEPKNIEIRLIRLSIQENSPKIVNYKKNITDDKSYILQNLASQKSALRNYVYQYSIKSNAFSESEKAILRQAVGLDK